MGGDNSPIVSFSNVLIISRFGDIRPVTAVQPNDHPGRNKDCDGWTKFAEQFLNSFTLSAGNQKGIISKGDSHGDRTLLLGVVSGGKIDVEN